MREYLLTKRKYLTYLFFFLWSIFWLSINTTPDLIYLYSENILRFINSLRLSSALLISMVLFIYLILKVSVKNLDSLILNFILLSLTYTIAIIFDDERSINLNNLYLVILSLGSISLFLLYKKFFEINSNGFLIINIIFLSIIILSIIIPKIEDIAMDNLNFYNSFAEIDYNLLLQANPRITGLSRTLAILNILILIITLNTKNYYLKFFYFFIFLLLGFIIWKMQSRGTILCFYSTVIFIIFFLNNFKLINKLIIILLIIFSTISFESIYGNKISLNQNVEFNTRILNPTTSGRIDIWKYSLKNYNFNKVFGYGSQGDRFFLDSFVKKKNYGNNSSNALLYAFLSGGYIGLILMFLIYFGLFKRIINATIFKIKNNIFYTFSISVIVFFVIRSLFENSFALFSIDYLLIFSSLIYSIQFEKKQK